MVLPEWVIAFQGELLRAPRRSVAFYEGCVGVRVTAYDFFFALVEQEYQHGWWCPLVYRSFDSLEEVIATVRASHAFAIRQACERDEAVRATLGLSPLYYCLDMQEVFFYGGERS